MSHKDRSIANMRCEAKKIYYQRREINRLVSEINALKEQYCERTDCVGRLGSSKKVERYEQAFDEIREVINQNMSSYASCIKAFDEIEEILNKVK